MKEKRTIGYGVANSNSVTNPSVPARTLFAGKGRVVAPGSLDFVPSSAKTASWLKELYSTTAIEPSPLTTRLRQRRADHAEPAHSSRKSTPTCLLVGQMPSIQQAYQHLHGNRNKLRLNTHKLTSVAGATSPDATRHSAILRVEKTL